MLEYAAPTTTNTDSDVIGQIKLAFANPLPLVIGALIGALVPIATYTVGHAELDTAGWGSVPGAIVIGGCIFSAITVYKWGRRAFDSAFKALGFVVLSEGVMSFSHVAWLSMVMLGALVSINAVANGANLAIAHLDAERRRAEAGNLATVSLPLPLAIQAPPTLTAADPVPVAAEDAAASPVAKKSARKRTRAKGIKTSRGSGRAVSASQLN
jgi:hypothetical protein